MTELEILRFLNSAYFKWCMDTQKSALVYSFGPSSNGFAFDHGKNAVLTVVEGWLALPEGERERLALDWQDDTATATAKGNVNGR